jgi:hypothetical protein
MAYKAPVREHLFLLDEVLDLDGQFDLGRAGRDYASGWMISTWPVAPS